MRLTAEGKSLRETRRYIEEAWGDVGPSTDTPWPPEGI
jgi:hypothetical protein